MLPLDPGPVDDGTHSRDNRDSNNVNTYMLRVPWHSDCLPIDECLHDELSKKRLRTTWLVVVGVPNLKWTYEWCGEHWIRTIE